MDEAIPQSLLDETDGRLSTLPDDPESVTLIRAVRGELEQTLSLLDHALAATVRR
jgi:hypothetical protein